jgi:hypothetical protein
MQIPRVSTESSRQGLRSPDDDKFHPKTVEKSLERSLGEEIMRSLERSPHSAFERLLFNEKLQSDQQTERSGFLHLGVNNEQNPSVKAKIPIGVE